MTEVPEHLLKRSKERRAALGLGGGDDAAPASDASPAAATPATTASTEAAPAAPSGPPPRKGSPAAPSAPPPKPDAPYVAAAKRRATVPFWAMAGLSLLPLWGFMYVRSLTTQEAGPTGPLAVGTEVYRKCASCHGGSGEGGSGGYAFTEGDATLTFPHIEDQIRWVSFGSDAYNAAGVTVYGDPNRPGGAHATGGRGVMPGWGSVIGGELTDAEIVAVVCHERFDLGGLDTAEGEFAEEFANWCSEESPIYAALEAGTPLSEIADAGIATAEGDEIPIIPIGEEPAPATVD